MIPKLFELCASLGLLIIVIHGHPLIDEIQNMANKNLLINGIFKPVKLMELFAHGCLYEGETKGGKRVVMKFIAEKYIHLAVHEYEIYSYLDAIKTNVEQYGIPNIYYFDRYNDDYLLLVTSHFECSLVKKLKDFQIQPLDCLIIFRDFVRQSKYMHSRRVRYDDMRPEKIVLNKHRSFLIDFEYSAKMGDKTERKGANDFLPRSYYEKHERTALDDWESFLYVMCKLYKVNLMWFNKNLNPKLSEDELDQMYGDWKNDTANTIECIKAGITCRYLKEVFVEFAKQAFKKDRSPAKYDELDTLIMKNIKIVGKEEKNRPAIFTWLSEVDRDVAIPDLWLNHVAEASKIIFKEPFKHEDVEYSYFYDRKERLRMSVTRSDAFLSNRHAADSD